MKKILFTIPVFLIFFHFMYASDGPQVWTQLTTIAAGSCNFGLQVNSTNPQIMYCGSNGGGVYKSTDGGVTWATSNSGLTDLTVYCLAISPSNPSILYAGTTANGIFKTTNDGGTWTVMSTGITQTPDYIQCIGINSLDPNKVCIGVWDGSTTIDAAIGLFRTTNGGTSWAPSNTGMLTDKNILSLVVNRLNPNTVYAGTSFAGGVGPCYVYKSYDGGATWTNSSTGFGTTTTDNDPVRGLSMSTIDTVTILAGRFFNSTNGGPWLSTNGGTSWTQIAGGITPTAPGSLIRSVLIRPGSNTEFFFGGDATTAQPGGVWRTTNSGGTWSDFNGGSMLNTMTVRSLGWRTTDNTLFAGVSVGASGVHGYTFPPTGVHDPGNGIPKDFSLNQNYPNPFNPSTVIDFAVPKTAFVTVKVYDLMGKEVKTLVNETKQAGYYSLNFNASNLTSGVYFYKITAGDFTASKKMMLVK